MTEAALPGGNLGPIALHGQVRQALRRPGRLSADFLVDGPCQDNSLEAILVVLLSAPLVGQAVHGDIPAHLNQGPGDSPSQVGHGLASRPWATEVLRQRSIDLQSRMTVTATATVTAEGNGTLAGNEAKAIWTIPRNRQRSRPKNLRD